MFNETLKLLTLKLFIGKIERISTNERFWWYLCSCCTNFADMICISSKNVVFSASILNIQASSDFCWANMLIGSTWIACYDYIVGWRKFLFAMYAIANILSWLTPVTRTFTSVFGSSCVTSSIFRISSRSSISVVDAPNARSLFPENSCTCRQFSWYDWFSFRVFTWFSHNVNVVFPVTLWQDHWVFKAVTRTVTRSYTSNVSSWSIVRHGLPSVAGSACLCWLLLRSFL